MEKGISPVIAVVLLIAIAVISAVGVWYWVGGLASKPGGVQQAQTGFTIESCDTTAGDQKVLVRNTGSTDLTGNASVYDQSNEEVGVLRFDNASNGELGVSQVEYVRYDNITVNGSLGSGETYTVIEGGLPTVQFTC